MLLAVGGVLLFAPAAMHAANGVDLGDDASLLSDVRAPGGALLALGAIIVAGPFVPWLTLPAAMISATVYLAYGLSRLLSIVLDGMPAPGLVYAAGLELVLGAVSAVLFARLRRLSGEPGILTIEKRWLAKPAPPYPDKAKPRMSGLR